MKKKLTLDKETIRKLAVDELARIGGGIGETFTCHKCDPPDGLDYRRLSPADPNDQTTGGDTFFCNWSFGASDSLSGASN